MLEFFAKDWKGEPFQLFGTAHLIGLALVALAITLLIIVGRRSNARTRRALRYGLATVLVVNETLWHLWNWSIGAWSIQTMLPLHLCSLMVWLCAYMLVKEDYRLYEFIYFLGIGVAMQALITPDAGKYGFPHFRFFQVLVSHGAIVGSAIYMTLVEGNRPHWSSLLKVGIGANIYLLFVGLVNGLIGSNYMFIASKPATASLMDIMPPWPWYILVIEGIGLVAIVALYLPFALHDARAHPPAVTVPAE